MPEENTLPTYLVDAYSDPVNLKINGRANYLNCAPLGDFFKKMIKKEKFHFRVDLEACTGMDSTFLGLLAGVSFDLKKTSPDGEVVLTHVRGRNLEIIENLGLHRVLSVNPKETSSPIKEDSRSKELLESMSEGAANPSVILKAHENLVRADNTNLNKFQDVIDFLKQQANQEVDNSNS